jgi:hypothetical protein
LCYTGGNIVLEREVINMKWFKDVFLASFEVGTRKISEKQAEIFKKYLKQSYEKDNAEYFTDCINGISIKLQDSLVFNGCYYDKKGRHTKYYHEYYLTIE